MTVKKTDVRIHLRGVSEDMILNNGRKYYFLKIAETLNITRAAEQLLVSQPSLTQYLNRLEADMEIRLVDRNYTPLRLTRAGQLYAEYLLEEKAREDQFLVRLEELKNENKAPLRLGIPLQKRQEKLNATLLHFCMDHPRLDVQVWEGTSSTVRERIVKGELDIGFGHSTTAQDEKCVMQILTREKILIICSRENPMLRLRESENGIYHVTAEDLNHQLFYQMSPEYYLCDVELKHLQQHGVSPLKKLVMSNLHGIIDSLLQNPSTGFAYMPDYVLQEHWPKSVSGNLAFLSLDDEEFAWFFCMERKKGKTLSRDGKSFWDAVVKNCSEEDFSALS